MPFPLAYVLLEANPNRKVIMVQKIGSTGMACVGDTNPRMVSAIIAFQQFFSLPNQYDWLELSKSQGYETDKAWYIYAYNAETTVVLIEGIEGPPEKGQREKPQERPM